MFYFPTYVEPDTRYCFFKIRKYVSSGLHSINLKTVCTDINEDKDESDLKGMFVFKQQTMPRKFCFVYCSDINS